MQKAIYSEQFFYSPTVCEIQAAFCLLPIAYCLTISLSRPTRPTAAAAAGRTLTERRAGLLRAITAARIVLAYDYSVAFLNIIAYYFRHATVGQTRVEVIQDFVTPRENRPAETLDLWHGTSSHVVGEPGQADGGFVTTFCAIEAMQCFLAAVELTELAVRFEPFFERLAREVVERDAGAQHGLSQSLLFSLIHSLEVDRHQQRADLIVRDFVVRYTRDKEINLCSRELLAVALLTNDILRSQRFFLMAYSLA